MKSAVRNARRNDFEIANTFVPAGTLFRQRLIWVSLRLVHAAPISAWNSVLSVQMAWRMTAILRPTATFAFLAPIRLVSLLPQRLSAEPRLTTAASNR